MIYTEYMVMMGYKVEQELRDKQLNEPYRLNQEITEERPQRQRPVRFRRHFDPDKPDQKR
jgi:hypothetical protein